MMDDKLSASSSHRLDCKCQPYPPTRPTFGNPGPHKEERVRYTRPVSGMNAAKHLNRLQ